MSIIQDISGSKITVATPNGHKTFDLLEIVRIDDTDISDAFVNQAALYAYFSNLLAEAEREAAIAKINAERMYATLDKRLRQEHELADKKTTENSIKSLIQSNDKYTNAVSDEIEASYDVRVLKMLTSALEQRAEMLISLGAHMRQEMSMTGMKIRSYEDKVGSQVRETISNKRSKMSE